MTLNNLIRFAAKTVIISSVTVLAASCNREVPAGAVVSVGASDLTADQIARALPKGLSAADSAAFVESYISSWISDRLVTEVAAKNLPDTREIDRMAEDYKRNLIMWEYLRRKISQDPELAISKDSVSAYYEAHRSEFITTEPLVRGIYVRISSDSPSISEVRKWYRSSQASDVEKLEKASFKDESIIYDYFRDRWVPWSQIKAALPSGSEVKLFAGSDFNSEVAGNIHMLHIYEMLPVGAIMPEEIAEPLIIARLEAQRRVELERMMRADLYKQAVEDGTIRWHDTRSD